MHSAGGTLLQHVKEHRLHCGVGEGDRVFYFTTCGWMMWNWLASGLASGATLLLYDGSPFHPDGNILFDFADREAMTYFGTSAKFIDSVRKAGLKPIETHDLSTVRTISSTGSPLSPEGFPFVYDGIKQDVHLASISGGTDIVSCFVLGVPTEPVWVGEIQGPGLGMAVDVWDDDGRPCRGREGRTRLRKGLSLDADRLLERSGRQEISCRLFRAVRQYLVPWRFRRMDAHGGLIIHGRSDATLNPGGVRIGTAEIYNQVEQMPEIAEALCIGQDFEDDVRVVLFVRLAAGVALNEDLERRIRTKIRTGASPRHVPAKIIAVADIPAHQVGQDHRTRRARGGARPSGEEQGGAGQPRGAGAFPRPSAAKGVRVCDAQIKSQRPFRYRAGVLTY